MVLHKYESCHEKTCLCDIRPGTQTGQYSHSSLVAKTEALIVFFILKWAKTPCFGLQVCGKSNLAIHRWSEGRTRPPVTTTLSLHLRRLKAHQKEELRDLLRKKNIHMVYVPASCTDRLQPLDLSVNASFKLSLIMKNCFEDWYSGEVAEQLKVKSPEDVEISMSLSTVKPLHAKWLVSVFQKLERDKDLIKRGFSDAGIV